MEKAGAGQKSEDPSRCTRQRCGVSTLPTATVAWHTNRGSIQTLSRPGADPHDEAGVGVTPMAIRPSRNRRGKDPEDQEEDQDSRHALHWMHAGFPTNHATLEDW
jgi:hypothetical protein